MCVCVCVLDIFDIGGMDGLKKETDRGGVEWCLGRKERKVSRKEGKEGGGLEKVGKGGRRVQRSRIEKTVALMDSYNGFMRDRKGEGEKGSLVVKCSVMVFLKV